MTAKAPNSQRRQVLKAALALCVLPFGYANAANRELHLLVPARFQLDASHHHFSREHGVQLTLHRAEPGQDLAAQWYRSRADICLVSGDQSPAWRNRGLLAPWNTRQLPQLAAVHEPLLRTAFDHWRFGKANPHWIPTQWGAEGISWRTDLYPDITPHSYAALWENAVPNSTFIRPGSALHTVAYLLESQGQLRAGAVLRADHNAAASERMHAAAFRYMREHKDRVKMTWSDAGTQIQGLLEDGAALGQGWDAPALALRTVDEPVNFCAPEEGALCWAQGWVLADWSKRAGVAHAFLAQCLEPELAGKALSDHGFNAAVRGAEKHTASPYRDQFREVFTDQVIARLRPAPQQSNWHRDINQAYAFRFLRA